MKCRLSGEELREVMDFGELYISDFLETRDLSAPKARLRLGLGKTLQLMDTVDPAKLYNKYWYRSGTNQTMRRQLKDIVDDVGDWVRLELGDIALDIGCNDGTLLSYYPKDALIVGIDPAENMEKEAYNICDLHSKSLFTKDVFLSLTGGQKAKVITSIAMFYDLDDPNSFVEDIRECLSDDGIWVIQLSYTPLMIAQNAFDNICHEHIEYYTLASIEYLLKQHGLKILDAKLNDTNSGSIRLVVAKSDCKLRTPIFMQNIGEFRKESLSLYESYMNMDNPNTYTDFKGRIDSLRGQTIDLLTKIKHDGGRIIGYGASTKGNTLLQYYNITSYLMDAIAERQPQKVGLLTVGSWIPIISEEEMRKRKPDYLFVLTWHFINEFVDREKDFLKGGGKIIVPLPDLKVISYPGME